MSTTTAQAKPAMCLIETSFTEDGYLDTGVSAALMRQVIRGEVAPTVRLHRTGPILAFGRLDRLHPGYPRAVELARRAGYQPVVRLAGGRAAVFHEGTISLSSAIRATGRSGAYSGTRERFKAMATTIADALVEIGVDARVGEVPGEYCPGEFSVNARGASKLAGIGQRVIVGGAHVGAVIVVRGAERIRTALGPIYEALELDWQPETAGSVAAETGNDDDPIEANRPDSLIEQTMAAVRTILASTYALEPTELTPSTLTLAKQLAGDHQPR